MQTMCAPLAASRFARSYDPLDRIDLETGPAGARNHDFDPNGNRTTDGAGTTAGFTPSTDRLATINGIAVTLDAAGNLTSDGTYKYLWNSLGQLAELRKPDNTLVASYYYDHQNLRTRKLTTAAAPQGISKTFYHYDQTGHLIAETTPGNTPQATYIWNGDVLTGLIVHQPQRTVYTVQTDHLGSPFQVRTLAGQVVWRWESEAFGKTLPNEDVDGDGNKLTLNLRFPGQYFDRESGLHYNWNRYYSPKLARYLSPDPIGLAAGPNLFAYAGGNPISNIDPEGKNAIALGAGGGALIAGPPGAVVGAVIGGIALVGAVAYEMCKDEDKECEKEWREARRVCRELIYEQMEQAAGRRKKRSVTGVTGGYTDVEQCARGLVSKRCGGNEIER